MERFGRREHNIKTDKYTGAPLWESSSSYLGTDRDRDSIVIYYIGDAKSSSRCRVVGMYQKGEFVPISVLETWGTEWENKIKKGKEQLAEMKKMELEKRKKNLSE